MRQQLPGQQAAQSDHQHSRAAPGSVDTGALEDGTVTPAKLDSSVYGGVPSSIDEGDSGAAGTAATVSRSDHQHAMNLVMVPIGGAVIWTTNTAPTGWLLCDGAAVSRTTFAALFAVIGTTYGAGDGSTTFNLPNAAGRFVLGKAAAGTGSTLGGTGGSIDHVHGLDTTSSHARVASTAAGTARMYYSRKTVASWASNRGVNGSEGPTTVTDTFGAALGGDSDIANPPFIALQFIIRAT